MVRLPLTSGGRNCASARSSPKRSPRLDARSPAHVRRPANPLMARRPGRQVDVYGIARVRSLRALFAQHQKPSVRHLTSLANPVALCTPSISLSSRQRRRISTLHSQCASVTGIVRAEFQSLAGQPANPHSKIDHTPCLATEDGSEAETGYRRRLRGRDGLRG